MAKLLLQTSPRPLPPLIRQKLTLQSALMTNPRKYIKNVRFDDDKLDTSKVIPERELPPKPAVVSENTQTKDVMDAETNTKMTRFSTLETRKSRLKMKCCSWIKMAKLASRSQCEDIARKIYARHGSGVLKKVMPALANTVDSKRDLPETKRRRGILKKVLEEVKIDGMCTQGTTTDGKRPTLDRILKENHIFLKYAKGSKPKKKRVRMEKRPAFSYINTRPSETESLVSAAGAAGAEGERKRVTMEGVDSEESIDEPGLERKPARLALRASSGCTDQAPDGSRAVLIRNLSSDAVVTVRCSSSGCTDAPDGGRTVLVRHVSSAPQLNSTKDNRINKPHPPRLREFSNFPGARRR